MMEERIAALEATLARLLSGLEGRGLLPVEMCGHADCTKYTMSLRQDGGPLEANKCKGCGGLFPVGDGWDQRSDGCSR